MLKNKDKTLLILAAGMGSRYGGLKQLDSVGPNGETILDYSVFDAIRAGFTKVVFVIRKDFEDAFKDKVVQRYEGKDISVELVFQDTSDLPKGFELPDHRTKPWGTGHALLSAKSAIQGPFAVINADDYYGVAAFKSGADQLDTFSADGLHVDMIGYELGKTLSDNGTVSRGVCEIREGKLVNVQETHGIARQGSGIVHENSEPILSDESVVSMNFWLYSKTVFELVEELWLEFLKEKGNELKSEFGIPDVATRAIEKGDEVEVLTSAAQWAGVTYKEDRDAVTKTLKQYHDCGDYPATLFLEV